MEKEFTVSITTQEHPGCFGKHCKSGHLKKYLVIKTKSSTNLFEEGHYIYTALFRFAEEHPEIIKDMRTIQVERESLGERQAIRHMLSEMAEAIYK